MATSRRYTRRSKRRTRGGGDFWISFSDLMSSLLLIFILRMKILNI